MSTDDEETKGFLGDLGRALGAVALDMAGGDREAVKSAIDKHEKAKAAATREPGFYWVRCLDFSGVERGAACVAEWYAADDYEPGYWLEIGDETSRDDERYRIISERLLPPTA